MSTILSDAPTLMGWSLIDQAGKVLASHVSRSTVDSMKEFYVSTNREYGVALVVKPSEPVKPTAITFSPDALRPFPQPSVEPKLPEIESGQERAYLSECISNRAIAGGVLEVAEATATRAREHLARCEAEVVRLRAVDEAETAAAGAQLADRLKAGHAAPLEPNLRTGRTAVLDAEARRDAATEACALLDAEVQAGKSAHGAAEYAVGAAVDVVIRAELQERIDRLRVLWEELMPLRQLIDDALTIRMPINIPAAKDVLSMPQCEYMGNAANRNRLIAYRKELAQSADASFEVQCAEVKK
ncbi:hypothetical protein WK39_03130 [Burkholderia cepacia]|uniref:hypothetical protein n=1 Tax=Burkholderia cepacia TaxID=292 RepID=UPI0007571311|nr:hypothetical protein [Burkholderia cepacia]KVS53285.1 hypothetical protein WK39_03130 [Burkholderia cepacia]KVS57749.1 hypothetical protein WK40_25580 [Burkholderia cepacia]CAG9268999.1 conserved hypothetical protein [Burkholderia cepacia]